MTCLVTTVMSVRALGDNLSVVSLEGIEHEVVANRQPDGSFRWRAGEPCVYVAEDSVVPEDVLKERGYWNDEKEQGLLGGKKGNRVKGRNFGPEEERVRSVGLLFKVEAKDNGLSVSRGEDSGLVDLGDDVAPFLGITA